MIVNNIASQTEEPTYNNIMIQLRDLITAPKNKSIKITDTEIPTTAFSDVHEPIRLEPELGLELYN
jgi:hypothetical protein